MVLEMKVPSPGESITEVEIAEWLVEDGDYVEKDQAIAEVDSDKATLELPAEESGIITLKAEVGDAVAVRVRKSQKVHRIHPIKRKKPRRKNLKKRLPKKKSLKKKLMLPELRLRQLKRYWTKKVFPLLLYQVLEGMEESPRKML